MSVGEARLPGRELQWLAALARSVVESDARAARAAVEGALDAGISPLEALEQGLSVGIQEVGDRFGRGELFLPELLGSSMAMQAALDVLKARWANMASERRILGKVVLGTVKGDIHSIGKQILASLLMVAGFEVVDLGVDVPDETFVAKVEAFRPDILGLSSLLTTTTPLQRRVIRALEKAGLRGSVKVMVGGAPTTQEWAAEIGADGWAPNASLAVQHAKVLLGAGPGREVRG